MEGKRMVIALGGNAITLPAEEGNVAQQFAHTRETVRVIADLVCAGYHIAITHGNGPQVGNILRRVEIAAEHDVYPIPLALCVADTQGGMGYMIEQCLENELFKRGLHRKCATVITTVLVDEADPAFSKPTKPIGVFYREDEAQRHRQRDGWNMVEIPRRGWRRVVPSPAPLEIIEIGLIRKLVQVGEMVVCCGGGGIPVAREHDGSLHGVEAVIDKDATAALLAATLDVDCLAILTNVRQVFAAYGTPEETPLPRMTVSEARRRLENNEFPAGSMGPKIQAAVDFLERSRQPNPSVLITDPASLTRAIAGEDGTWIRRDAGNR
jgi:carbamate kinase